MVKDTIFLKVFVINYFTFKTNLFQQHMDLSMINYCRNNKHINSFFTSYMTAKNPQCLHFQSSKGRYFTKQHFFFQISILYFYNKNIIAIIFKIKAYEMYNSMQILFIKSSTNYNKIIKDNVILLISSIQISVHIFNRKF